MIRVLGVHGVGNFQPGRTAVDAAGHLRGIWADVLRRQLDPAPIDLQMAYYAHHLNRSQPQGPLDDPDLLPAGAKELVRGWAAMLGVPDEVTQGRATAPVRQIADWVTRRFQLSHRAVGWFIALFFRELSAYLLGLDDTARLAARAQVAAAISAHRPQAVIAHSLGSVVAYEALCARPDTSIDLFVTLGSPLAMPGVVFDRLQPRPAANRAARPPGVRRWVNISDVGDIIAVPHFLGGRFDLDADYEETIALFEFHRVTRYLASARTAAVLATVPVP